MNDKKLDLNSQRALDLFRRAQAAKEEQAQNPNAPVANVGPLRVRLSKHVDLTKADQSCKRCHGVGVSGYQLQGTDRIPIVCRCVAKRGGVQHDKLDQLLGR